MAGPRCFSLMAVSTNKTATDSNMATSRAPDRVLGRWASGYEALPLQSTRAAC